MVSNNTTLEIEYPGTEAVNIIRQYFLIILCVGIIIELIFCFVMTSNWCMKSTFLRSAFFYLLTLKIVNDMIYMSYTVVITYWKKEVEDFNSAVGTPFFITSSEIDTLSQFFIAVNRYTAMMMPLKQERIWSTTITFSVLIVIVLLSATLTYLEIKIFEAGNPAIFLPYNSYKLILIICSLILIFIPIVKHFFESKATNNSNPTLFTNVSTNSNSKKQKAEKQLLYETVFICFWKAANIGLNTFYITGISSCFWNATILLLIDVSVYISNVGGLIALFFISSVVREGFKQSFKIGSNRKGVSVSMAFSTVKKTARTK